MNSNSIGVWDTPDLFCICLGSNQWFGKCIPRTSQAATAAQEQAASLVIFIDEEKKSFKPSGLLDKAIGISDNYDSSWIFANFPEEELQQPICFSWYARVPFSHTFHHFPPCKEAENLIVKCSSAASDQESVMKANNNSWYTTQHFSW